MSHTRWPAPIVVDPEVGVCTWVRAKSVKYESRCFSPFCCHFLYCSFLNFLVPLLLKVWIFVICIISSLHEVVEIPRAIRFENIFSEGLQYIISSLTFLYRDNFTNQGGYSLVRRDASWYQHTDWVLQMHFDNKPSLAWSLRTIIVFQYIIGEKHFPMQMQYFVPVSCYWKVIQFIYISRTHRSMGTNQKLLGERNTQQKYWWEGVTQAWIAVPLQRMVVCDP